MDSSRRQTINDAIVRLSDGEREVFPVLMDQLWPAILAFARRGVGHEADAEDIAQEVFLRICSRISEFDKARDGVSWAFGIASFEIMTHRRRVYRRREVQAAEPHMETTDLALPLDERLIRQQVMAALEQVLGELTEQDRQALGLSKGALNVEVSGPTRRKRRQRAMERLREVWRSIYGES